MCLAVPGKIIRRADEMIEVDLQGSRLTVSGVLTPQAGAGDWVLIHAGFAIEQLDEDQARETFAVLREAGIEVTKPD